MFLAVTGIYRNYCLRILNTTFLRLTQDDLMIISKTHNLRSGAKVRNSQDQNTFVVQEEEMWLVVLGLKARKSKQLKFSLNLYF